MTHDNTYNGWANYETWRVQLEVFDGLNLHEWNIHRFDLGDLSDWMKEYVESHIEETTQVGLARDYALAFVSNVNWNELARHARDDYESEAA